jgi:hypothetical protein
MRVLEEGMKSRPHLLYRAAELQPVSGIIPALTTRKRRPAGTIAARFSCL